MDLSLRGYATEVLRARPAAELPAMADDLEGLLQVVEANANLSSALSDVTVPAPARSALVQDLFGDRVGDAALRMVAHAVDTERAPELVPALHDLGELARLWAERPEEADALDERPLGHGALRRLLRGMVAAELQPVADVDELQQIEDELFRFGRTVAANPPLRAALSDWSVPAGRRTALVASLLQGKAGEVTVRLAQAVTRLRSRDVAALLQWASEQVADARGWRVASVRAAMDVDEDERQRLGDAMQRLTGRPVEVRVTVDPSLIGGAQVAIGDLLVDATTRHRLDQLQEQMRGHEGALHTLLGDQPGGR